MNDFRTQLAHRFRKQQQFADDYSPLYARLFGIVADWLEGARKDEFVDWLVAVGNGRSPLDITLLLLAGLHRDVLNQEPAAAELAQYYPSADGKHDFNDAHLPRILRQTILARRDALAPFIQTATVQTNETARGLCWLLPLLYTGWDAVNLVDLGASAGLNLVAEARKYRLLFSGQWAVDSGQFFDVGNGRPVQFLLHTQGAFHQPPTASRQPQILSRTGCDLAPFHLNTLAKEQTLAAYIWADQLQRLERLREGLAAFHQVVPPVQLHPVRLPDELPGFLATAVPRHYPIIIYNTYMTAYLDDNGRALRHHIAQWAETQNRPILWLQWEPLWDGPEPPGYGWVAWTADLWQDGKQYHWQLAWNHPHGTPIHWLSDLAQFAAFWQTA